MTNLRYHLLKLLGYSVYKVGRIGYRLDVGFPVMEYKPGFTMQKGKSFITIKCSQRFADYLRERINRGEL